MLTILRITRYLTESNVQPGASYPVGQLTTSRCKEGELAGAEYIGASLDEIGTCFLSSTSNGILRLAF